MTKKIIRKLQRQKLKEKKKLAEKEMTEKLGMFDDLPEECLTCNLPFDRKDREQVMTWNVVVNKQEGSVRLYCPDCWTKAIEIINNFKQKLEEKNG